MQSLTCLLISQWRTDCLHFNDLVLIDYKQTSILLLRQRYRILSNFQILEMPFLSFLSEAVEIYSIWHLVTQMPARRATLAEVDPVQTRPAGPSALETAAHFC